MGGLLKNRRTVASEDKQGSRTHTPAHVYRDTHNKTAWTDSTCLRRPYKDSQIHSESGWVGAPAEATAGNTGEQTPLPLLVHTHTCTQTIGSHNFICVAAMIVPRNL